MKLDELAVEAATCSGLSWEVCSLAFMLCLIRQVAKLFWPGGTLIPGALWSENSYSHF